MTWESFYLACFVVGLLLSAISLLGGMGRFGAHVHVPHAAHLPHAAHVLHAGVAKVGGGRGAATAPWWNSFSAMIFLCWFGATGYLLTRHGTLVTGVVLALAMACGFAGGAIVFLFLTRVMLPHEHELTAEETEIVGAVGKVSSAIRAGGTGEVVYEQLGARRRRAPKMAAPSPGRRKFSWFATRKEWRMCGAGPMWALKNHALKNQDLKNGALKYQALKNRAAKRPGRREPALALPDR